MAASLVRSVSSWVLTCAWSAVTVAIRLSSRDTCFSASKICWPSAIRLNSDWFSDFSSISAWASDAVRAPINCPWASRFCSVGPAGEGLAEGNGDGDEASVQPRPPGAIPGFGLGAAEGEAPGMSARTPAGSTSKPSITARLTRRTATLGPRLAPAATEGRDFTALQKSLQLFRRGPLRPAPLNPKRCLRGPLPARIRIRRRAARPSWAPCLTVLHFHISVTPCPLAPFVEALPDTCRGLTCATILKNQLELSRGK